MCISPFSHHLVQLLFPGNVWSLYTSSRFLWTPFFHNSMLTIVYFGSKSFTQFYCGLLVVIFFGRNFENVKRNFVALPSSPFPPYYARRCFTLTGFVYLTGEKGPPATKSILRLVSSPMIKWLLSDCQAATHPQETGTTSLHNDEWWETISHH